MNQINPEKLLLSKWTAKEPANGEKHFIVRELVRDDSARVVGCHLEAVTSGRINQIDWQLLRDNQTWLQGWI